MKNTISQCRNVSPSLYFDLTHRRHKRNFFRDFLAGRFTVGELVLFDRANKGPRVRTPANRASNIHGAAIREFYISIEANRPVLQATFVPYFSELTDVVTLTRRETTSNKLENNVK